MAKQLLIEHMLVQPLKISSSQGTIGYVKESRGGKTIIRFPATTINVKNENGRIYSLAVMENACRNASEALKERRLLCTANGHPDEPFVEPINASHVATNVWCENNLLWMEAEVLNTRNGQDLAALIESEIAIGVSIRGLGSTDNFGNILEDYEFLGADFVGQPSAKIYTVPTTTTAGASKPLGESNEGNKPTTLLKETKMNLQQAKEYMAEQCSAINASKDRVSAYKAAAQVESTLSGLNLPFMEMAQIYDEWKQFKADAFSEANGSKSLEESKEIIRTLEESIKTQNTAYQENLNNTRNKYEKSLATLTRAFKLESVNNKSAKARIAKLEKRDAILKNHIRSINAKLAEAVDKIKLADKVQEATVLEAIAVVKSLQEFVIAESSVIIRDKLSESKGNTTPMNLKESKTQLKESKKHTQSLDHSVPGLI